MHQTFEEKFRGYDPDQQDRLLKRFLAGAIRLCREHAICESNAGDLVQDAFERFFPSHREFTPNGSLRFLLRSIEWRILDLKRRREFEQNPAPQCDEEGEEYDSQLVDGVEYQHPEHIVDTHRRLALFISETQELISEFCSRLGVRRRDFQERATLLLETFYSDPEKYVRLESPRRSPAGCTRSAASASRDGAERAPRDLAGRILVSELARDLGMTEHAFQAFRARIDDMLSGSGLTLDLILLRVAAHHQAELRGFAQNALRLNAED